MTLSTCIWKDRMRWDNQGSVEKKAIERLDERIILPIAEGLAGGRERFRHGGASGSSDTDFPAHTHGGQCTVSAL